MIKGTRMSQIESEALENDTFPQENDETTTYSVRRKETLRDKACCGCTTEALLPLQREKPLSGTIPHPSTKGRTLSPMVTALRVKMLKVSSHEDNHLGASDSLK